MANTTTKDREKKLRNFEKRFDHFETIMRREIGMADDWVRFFLHRALHGPTEAIRALDTLTDQLQGKDRGRMKRCIKGIHKAYSSLNPF